MDKMMANDNTITKSAIGIATALIVTFFVWLSVSMNEIKLSVAVIQEQVIVDAAADERNWQMTQKNSDAIIGLEIKVQQLENK